MQQVERTVPGQYYRMRVATRRHALLFVSSLFSCTDNDIIVALRSYAETPGIDSESSNLLLQAAQYIQEVLESAQVPHLAVAEILRLHSELLFRQRLDMLSWLWGLKSDEDVAFIVPRRWYLCELALSAAFSNNRALFAGTHQLGHAPIRCDVIPFGVGGSGGIDSMSAALIDASLGPAGPRVLRHIVALFMQRQVSDLALCDVPPVPLGLGGSPVEAAETAAAPSGAVIELADSDEDRAALRIARQSVSPEELRSRVHLWMLQFGPPSFRSNEARKARTTRDRAQRAAQRHEKAEARATAVREQRKRIAEAARRPSVNWHSAVVRGRGLSLLCPTLQDAKTDYEGEGEYCPLSFDKPVELSEGDSSSGESAGEDADAARPEEVREDEEEDRNDNEEEQAPAEGEEDPGSEPDMGMVAEEAADDEPDPVREKDEDLEEATAARAGSAVRRAAPARKASDKKKIFKTCSVRSHLQRCNGSLVWSKNTLKHLQRLRDTSSTMAFMYERYLGASSAISRKRTFCDWINNTSTVKQNADETAETAPAEKKVARTTPTTSTADAPMPTAAEESE